MAIHPKDIKERVISLRKAGMSLGQIQKETNIPKTTIHSWITGIEVAEELRKSIRLNALQALQNGRIVSQKAKKEKRLSIEHKLIEKGIATVRELTDKELFVAGVALYWAEGFKNKHEHRLGFCNSDPAMVKFYIHWLEKCLGVPRRDLVARLAVNRIYEPKIGDLENYWSIITEIPLSQFTKPFYQNSQWKKHFNEDNYHGVLRIHVKNSLEHLLEMRGWIEGLKRSTPG